MAKNRLVHFEFRTRDRNRLKAFYAALFHWKFEEFGDSYTGVKTGNDECGGGIFQCPEGVPTGTSNYFDVDDLADYEAKVRELGGKVLMSNQEVPGHGWFSLCLDVDGNSLALWKGLRKSERKQLKKEQKQARKAEKQDRKRVKKSEELRA